MISDGAAPPRAVVYVAAAVTTDNRFDGMSRSDDRPTALLTVYYGRPDGLFAGTVLSKVDFGDFDGPSGEADLFGGRKFELGQAEVTVEGLASLFIDEKGRQPTYDFVEAQAVVQRRFGRLELSVNLGASPAYSYDGGRAFDLRGGVAYDLTKWLKLSAGLGRLQVQRSESRSYGNVGATAVWRRLTFDVRYEATDVSRDRCFGTRWCEPTVTATLGWRFMP